MLSANDEPLPIESWLSDEELNKIYSSSYWNDVEAEKEKGWWIADGSYDQCMQYLNDSGLFEEYKVSSIRLETCSN